MKIFIIVNAVFLISKRRECLVANFKPGFKVNSINLPGVTKRFIFTRVHCVHVVDLLLSSCRFIDWPISQEF